MRTRRVLVDDEEVAPEARDDEAEVELPRDGHAREVRLGQFGVFRFLDVTDVLVAFEVLVHELLDITKLELDGRLDVVVADHGGVIADDLQATFQATPVVIGQFEDEQVFEDFVAFFQK